MNQDQGNGIRQTRPREASQATSSADDLAQLDEFEACLRREREAKGIRQPEADGEAQLKGQTANAFQEAIRRRCPEMFRLAQRTPEEIELDLQEDARRQEEARRQENAQRIERAKAHFRGTLGKRYASMTLNNWEATTEPQHNAIGLVREYVANWRNHMERGSGIVIYGSSGTGKDHLLVGAGWELAAQGVRVDFVSAAKMFANIRDMIGSDESESQFVRELLKPAVLILSDPAPPKAALSDFQEVKLFEIIEGRWAECRPTWCSMNVTSGKEADDRIGARVVDRLRDGAVCIFADWQTHRKPWERNNGNR